MSKKLQLAWQKAVFFIPVAIVLFLFLIFLGYHFAYWQKIYPGVSVLGHSLGNQNLTTAQQTVKQIIAEANPQPALTLKTETQLWNLELADFEYLPQKTVEKAWAIGRGKNRLKNLQEKMAAWSQGINLSLEYSLNQTVFNQQLDQIADQVFVPAIEPAINITEDKKVAIESGKSGLALDKKNLSGEITSRLALLDFSPLDLPLINISPKLTETQIEKTQTRAESLLNKKIVLTAEEMTWALEDRQLVQWLDFNQGYDQEKIASWSAELAKTINRPSQNAAFEFKEGRVTQFREGKMGLQLEEEKTMTLIKNALAELEKGQTEITLALLLTTTPPLITTAEVNSLGIQVLVGQGVSYFRGSIASRIHNIQLASSRLNGLLIPPGETFSFNQALGEVSPATGFQQAYIIKEGRTVLGDGGGVCQVSTTLFRAALKAGLPIVERRAHAYRVSYYEQNSQVGLDATVYDPTADLKFKNDTSAHLLIQTTVNPKNAQLTFELYGTDDGRTVSLSSSRIWDQVPPPPDLYQDDPTLPIGQTKQIDWAAWGAKVSFDYKVVRNGEVLQERTFYSAYRPWQAIFLRGTKPTQ
ncbi:MAG: VanW family protein [Candidatus Marinimicrobia bacterium]|nr:VanW family protein [Candidatus Neomarinimicrobiota bacterium]